MANALAQFMVSQGYDANDTDAVSVFNGNLINTFNKNVPTTFSFEVLAKKFKIHEVLCTLSNPIRFVLIDHVVKLRASEDALGLLRTNDNIYIGGILKGQLQLLSEETR